MLHILRTCVFWWLLCPVAAVAVEDCTPYLAEMDAKIAAAVEAGHNVSMAQQIRESLVQACPYLDAASLRKMVDSLDAMFPAMSEFADLQAQMEAEAENPPAGPATSAPRAPSAATVLPVIGRTLGGRHLDRPDRMNQFGIWDLDVHGGSARVLYHTRPDRLQFAQPDWEFVIYTVVVDRNGDAKQTLITRRQASDHAALALRRGADEVLLQRSGTTNAADARLERWSIPSSSLLSSQPVPSPTWPDGRQRQWGVFSGVATDGNLFYVGTVPEDRNATEHTMSWFKTTLEGRVLGQGSLTRSDRLGPEATIGASAGRGAVLLSVSSDGERGIDTRLDVPIRREVAGRQVWATVGMEKRLFLIADDARSYVETPALERMLIWQGDMSIPQSLPSAEMLRQNRQQMAMMAEVERSVDAGRHVMTLNVGLERVDMVMPMQGDRYAALVNVSDDRSLEPPRHGAFLLEVSPERVTERLYLEPLAESLASRFQLLAVSPADQVYLYAQSVSREDDRVIRVSPAGRVEGYAPVDAGIGITVEGMVADDAGIWVFGRGVVAGKVGDRIWVERVLFED